jgi:hypothetical protein
MSRTATHGRRGRGQQSVRYLEMMGSLVAGPASVIPIGPRAGAVAPYYQSAFVSRTQTSAFVECKRPAAAQAQWCRRRRRQAVRAAAAAAEPQVGTFASTDEWFFTETGQRTWCALRGLCRLLVDLLRSLRRKFKHPRRPLHRLHGSAAVCPPAVHLLACQLRRCRVDAMELNSLTPDLPALLAEMGVRYDPDRLAQALAARPTGAPGRRHQGAVLATCVLAALVQMLCSGDVL